MGGLKCQLHIFRLLVVASHPTRDGWIEIHRPFWTYRGYSRPIPHGMGGLKSFPKQDTRQEFGSHPTRDGWIEIAIYDQVRIIDHGPIPHGMGGLKYHLNDGVRRNVASHPTRDGWIEINSRNTHTQHYESHPTRDGWIEIQRRLLSCKENAVPSHTGWVD